MDAGGPQATAPTPPHASGKMLHFRVARAGDLDNSVVARSLVGELGALPVKAGRAWYYVRRLAAQPLPSGLAQQGQSPVSLYSQQTLLANEGIGRIALVG
eukprot:4347453-Pleurochrysis_carterae.AAC.1